MATVRGSESAHTRASVVQDNPTTVTAHHTRPTNINEENSTGAGNTVIAYIKKATVATLSDVTRGLNALTPSSDGAGRPVDIFANP